MREAEEQIDFFDTSALVKRYHRELGTDVGATLVISHAGGMHSVYTADECICLAEVVFD